MSVSKLPESASKLLTSKCKVTSELYRICRRSKLSLYTYKLKHTFHQYPIDIANIGKGSVYE